MDDLTNFLSIASERFTTNLSASFTQLTATRWIRLVAIVGGYILIRGWLMKLGERAQMKQYEKEEKEAAEARAQAALSPNQLRGFVDLPEDSDEEDAGAGGKAAGKTSATEWGKKARKRQRKFVADMLDAQEQKLRESREEEEDKDIEEFLVEE